MLIVFLPAFNEKSALEKVVTSFHNEFSSQKLRIIVLNDGSTDGTARIASNLAKKFPMEILNHEENQGLGKTMIHGMEYIARTSNPEDIIITLDCDNTHDPIYVRKAIKKI
mgnify:FL=1